MTFWLYTWIWLSRAGRDYWGALDKSALQSIPVAFIGGGLLYAFQGEAAARNSLTEYVVFGLIAVTVWLGLKFIWFLVLAPWRVWRDLRALSDLQREALTPRLTLSIKPDAGTSLISGGNVSTTISGRTQAVMRWPETVVRIACTNTGPERLDACRAKLVSVREMLDDGSSLSVGFLEAVDLPWSRTGEDFEVSLDPGGTRAIYALTRPGHPTLHIRRNPNSIPIEYATMCEQGKTYRFIVSVAAASGLSSSITFDAFAEERNEVPPPLKIIIVDSADEPS